MASPSAFSERNGHYVIDLPGARAAFTTRRGGCSQGPYATLNLGFATDDDPAAQERNRVAPGELVGAPPAAFVRQVHGTEVGVLDGPGARRRRPEMDGRATRLRDVAVAALGADCLTVAIAGGGAVAMVHAGWRGLAAGVLDSGVRAVRGLAGDDVSLAAAIGPGAGPCCYEVGPEVHAAFADRPGGRIGDNLDLAAIAQAQLAQAGVATVHVLGLCTICNPQLFFSHRRDRGITGRQAGLAWLT